MPYVSDIVFHRDAQSAHSSGIPTDTTSPSALAASVSSSTVLLLRSPAAEVSPPAASVAASVEAAESAAFVSAAPPELPQAAVAITTPIITAVRPISFLDLFIL